jgi:hypothetical protein
MAEPEDDDDDDGYQRWWEDTFAERRRELERVYGVTHPPGSPQEYAVLFEWDDVNIPGGCCLVFPPRETAAAGHLDWVYASLGLTQPLVPDDVVTVSEAADPARSGYAAELGLVLAGPADWAPRVIRQLMWYVRARAPIAAGDRMPFGAEQAPDGSVDANIGDQAAAGAPVLGGMRALVFWPHLVAPATFTTATGAFSLLIGTTITAGEWEFARRRSSEHLLLLLHRAGPGQRSDLWRPCLTTDPAALREVRFVESMSRDEAAAALAALRRGDGD